VQDELHADQAEDRGQAVAEVDQPGQRPGQQEVERAQAEQGEGVGREDEVRVLGDPVHGRHGVDCEDQVGGEDGDHHDGERGQGSPAGLPHGQPGAGVVVGDREEPAQQADRAHVPDVDLLVVAGAGVPEHLDRGGDQDRAEDEERAGERVQRGGADGDEHAPQDKGADDPVEQHPLLQRRRHRERGQQQHEHEQVVDRQRLLDQVAGEELGAALLAVPRPDPAGEAERQRDVERRPQRRLAQGHLVRAAGQQEVDGDQAEHGGQGDRPQRRRSYGHRTGPPRSGHAGPGRGLLHHGPARTVAAARGPWSVLSGSARGSTPLAGN
jgi:hypothetical protein